MKPYRYALHLLGRDWRAGDLRLLAASVVLSVMAVSAVSWLAQRVGAATTAGAADLLAADLALRSPDPIAEAWIVQARRDGLKTAVTEEFPSVVLSGGRTQLVSVKAVQSGYPLRGRLTIAESPGGVQHSVRAVPKPGTVWVEPRLLSLLGLKVGDRLHLGAATLRISRLLELEPDRGGLFFSLAPRVLMNRDDLGSTGLIQPASRVRRQLLLAGRPAAVARFKNWFRSHGPPGVEIRTPGEGRRGVEDVLSKVKRFLGLSALLTVIVAGVAILLAVRRYAERQIDTVAIMGCLGATQGEVTALMACKLGWLGLFAGAAGLLLGFGFHYVLIGVLGVLLPPDLPSPGWRPVVSGLVVAFVSLVGFALPTVLRLRQVPPLRVLRGQLGDGIFRGVGVYVASLAVLFGLMWWQAEDLTLATYVFAAVLATLLAVTLLASAIVWTARYAHARSGAGAGFWLSGITRRPYTAVIQIMAVGIGLMALLLLSVVRHDLLGAWRARIPAKAPNYFLINVQPNQVGGLKTFLARRGDAHAEFHPMVRGRLVAINGHRVEPDDYRDARARHLVEREFNLSWARRLAGDNRIVAGRWWSDPIRNHRQLSVERDLAARLGIKLGDRLTFAVAGESIAARVTSLRRVDWDDFNVNFFVLAAPGLLDGMPASYITSVYIPPRKADALAELVGRFPSVTVIDINAILATVRGIIDEGARVVELMAGLTLLAGLMVLFAALQITGEERRFESALMRSLGATRARIARMVAVEFVLLGAAAGLIAGAMAAVAGHVLARNLFGLSYPFNALLIVLGVLGGGAVVWAAASLAVRRWYRTSPMRLLRE